jgi:hypothetical protein
VVHDIQDASLERFAVGRASREEAHAITRHLLQECPVCAEHLRKILRPSVAAADYGPALDAFARTCLGPPKAPETGRPPSDRARHPRSGRGCPGPGSEMR